MRVLLFGGMGMLGHRLWIRLSRSHEVWATVRDHASEIPSLPNVDMRRVYERLDVLDEDRMVAVFAEARPDVVINCIGLVKQHELMNDAVLALKLNSVLPHQLARLCRTAGTRAIQISTDCVFSGRTGGYTENDPPDPDDLYGRTKLLGELPSPDLTIRTSMIGRELRSRHGLLEWFLSQSGSVRGFTRAIFSGLSTLALSDVIDRVVLPQPELSGVLHVGGPAIAKSDLLEIAARSFGLSTRIVPDSGFVCDRSLRTDRFRGLTGYVPPSWEEMIADIASDGVPYTSLHLAAATP
jgi:dTDP-4-dehydrorhamnose reductase